MNWAQAGIESTPNSSKPIQNYGHIQIKLVISAKGGCNYEVEIHLGGVWIILEPGSDHFIHERLNFHCPDCKSGEHKKTALNKF